MEEIQYFGEHLWPKNIGHFLIILGFVSALFSAYSFFKSTNERLKTGDESEDSESEAWKRLGRLGFAFHGLSVFGIITIIFYIMVNQFYEYAYVSQHVNDFLPMKYITSAFWEGQEGSFLLWMFWHIILGFVVMVYGKKWEAPVLSLLALVEVILISMILGIQFEIGDSVVKIGSNPLLLFRDTMDIPLFQNADYVSLLSGSGLNPLLQNYWMTIHPPTLFLGFASTVIPFCFAVAGLWVKEPRAWIKPALKWSLFSGGILGIGILMGGAWAYEALSFGGYWAWDPVENMSLVPWLLMVAGVHSLLIANGTGRGIKTSYILLSLSFIMILYSTFLTRSGILGDTSVHAFTEMGLENQLVLLVALFTIIPAVVFIMRRKIVPSQEDDKFNSREFWMFIGAIVLLFSSILITASTSLPIYNKIAEIFDPGFTGLVIQEPITHYNKHQIWIAIFIVLLSSSAQFLRYNGRVTSTFKKKLLLHAGISVAATIVLTFIVNIWLDINSVPYFLLMLAGIFGIVSNVDYFIAFNKLQWKNSAGVLSHLGFSIMLIGIIASGVNKRHISKNEFVFRDIMEDENLKKKVTLIKGKPIFMSGYWVDYQRDTLIENERTYDIKFTKVDSNNQVLEEFMVNPVSVYSNDKTEIVAFNPSTKRYLHKDIFTHIAGLPAQVLKLEYSKEMEDSLVYQPIEVGLNGSYENDSLKVTLNGLDYDPRHQDYEPKENDLAIGFHIQVTDKIYDKQYDLKPVVVLRGAVVYKYYDEIPDLNMRIRANEAFFERFFTMESELEYQQFVIKEGESITIEDVQIVHNGFNKTPKNRGYKAEEGDIAIASILSFRTNGKTKNLEPVYLIRGSRQSSIKDYDPETGVHFKFTQIDPATGELTFQFAKDDRNSIQVPMEIAMNVPRSDIIVIESIEFPGINLFWLGSLMMLTGMLVAMGIRLSSRKVMD
ncbi:cytochrome c biogenesis protein CcsA [Portibacter marinus]|uniref:cytochrome c biogenesis protein CcsA n=1 Tax=Portibacter marinus TaxID=2898660 RepID=UPI001F219668|nr:cytochrome c biogenesis protein CcsA [Portibacter marinus]